MPGTSALIERLRTDIRADVTREADVNLLVAAGVEHTQLVLMSDVDEAIITLTTQAAEITRLTERLERAEGVIGPFAKAFRQHRGLFNGSMVEVSTPSPDNPAPEIEPMLSDAFRAAADFLGEMK